MDFVFAAQAFDCFEFFEFLAAELVARFGHLFDAWGEAADFAVWVMGWFYVFLGFVLRGGLLPMGWAHQEIAHQP